MPADIGDLVDDPRVGQCGLDARRGARGHGTGRHERRGSGQDRGGGNRQENFAHDALLEFFGCYSARIGRAASDANVGIPSYPA